MRALTYLFPTIALAGAALLLAPARGTLAFTTIGGTLPAESQRDYRIYTQSFSDSSANDSVLGSSQFPGWLGLELSLWKAAAEWGSRAHGTGAGDPNQAVIGDGGANFDFVFCGNADDLGGTNRNIISSTTGGSCDPLTFAYVETPINNGWRMLFCESPWTWSDNPDTLPGGQIDIQGIGTHEFGHSLGLGHSADPSATMVATTPNGFAQRSIESDDVAGVQFLYNLALVTKLEITSVSYDMPSNMATLTGVNFSGTGNEVWFTRKDPTGPADEPRLIVSGVSSSGGGTQIVVTVPAGAASGDVHVKGSFTGGSSLSNGFPLDIGVSGGPDPLTVTSITPSTVDALVPGTDQSVTVTGTGFTPSTTLNLDFFLPIAASDFTVVNDTTITVDLPQALGGLGSHTLFVFDGSLNAQGGLQIVAPTSPVIQCGNGDPLNTVSGSFETIAAGPVGQVHYVAYSGSNLPSVRGIASLDIGNSFTDLFLLDVYVIDAGGWTSKTFPLPAITADFYLQSLTLSQGFPIPVSNVQSIHVVP